MSQELLAALGSVLQETFYRERDQELLEFLKSESDLEAVSGIHDVEVLDQLTRIGITAESFAALMLIPLVRVAWADGDLEDHERDAVLEAAHSENILKDSPSHRLLEAWLQQPPPPKVLEAWEAYAKVLANVLDSASLAHVKQVTIDRARKVADACGGLLGLGSGNRVSQSEEHALTDLARCYDRH
jgi:hypothetical protein